MSNKLILVLNCGSSSLKFSLLDPNTEKNYFSGIAECLYINDSKINWTISNKKYEKKLQNKINHIEAFNFIFQLIKKNKFLNKIVGIGHRIVHGGKNCLKSTLINNDIIKKIEQAIPFAPLHNPIHLVCIKETMNFFPNLKNKNVAVFDTSFHQTLPESSYLYALPSDFYKKHGIRRYGAHGINHLYVMKKTSKLLNKTEKKLNIITCHLGNGSSVTAIQNGISIDTSMGLTPLEGLVMGTRSGDIDPAIIFFLYEHLNIKIKDIYNILTKESGLIALTEVTSDYRYIDENYNKKENATKAMNIFCHRLVKYIGAYAAIMKGKIDALIFTGGIGENSIILRKIVLSHLSFLGFKIDNEKNNYIKKIKIGFVNQNNTKPILVIPSNEDIIIAQDTIKLI